MRTPISFDFERPFFVNDSCGAAGENTTIATPHIIYGHPEMTYRYSKVQVKWGDGNMDTYPTSFFGQLDYELEWFEFSHRYESAGHYRIFTEVAITTLDEFGNLNQTDKLFFGFPEIEVTVAECRIEAKPDMSWSEMVAIISTVFSCIVLLIHQWSVKRHRHIALEDNPNKLIPAVKGDL
jgi:hypothetical protein